MKIVEFKTNISLNIDSQDIHLKPKSIYLFSDIIQRTFIEQTKNVVRNKIPKHYDINLYMKKIIKYEKQLEDVLTKFDIKKHSNNMNIKPVIIRTGGIGDLISLSSLCYHLPEIANINENNIYFISQHKYRDVFKQFRRPVKFVSYFSEIASYKKGNVLSKKRIFNSLHPIFFEGVIERNNSINWYLLQYGQINIDNFNPLQGRPQLKTERVSDKKSRISKATKSILINPRSTAIIRSMRFEDIYNALIDIVGNRKDITFYVHKRNLREQDFKWISQQILKDKRIVVIDAKNLDDFFLDVYDCDLSISVDTAQLHFREGIKKPAIGIYGTFTTDCRTKFYQYVHCFDIKSKCPQMPCTIHVKKYDECCNFQTQLEKNGEYDNKWHFYAPCTCQVWNKDLHSQLVDNMKDYINNNI